MTVTPVPVVGTSSQPRLVPYLSYSMFALDARRGVDIDNLVPGGAPPPDQEHALMQYIEAASAQGDEIMQQTLAATYDTGVGQANVGPDGYITIHPRYRPVIALTSFAYGSTPALLQPLASLTGTWVERKRFKVPVGAGGGLPVNTSQGPIQFGISGYPQQRVFTQYQYVNGYPITYLTANVAAGATQVSVQDTTGIVPGKSWLTIYAGRARFRFLAGALSNAADSSGIAAGPGNVTITQSGASQLPAHAIAVPTMTDPANDARAVMVSAVPADVIEGFVYLTRGLIKDPGAAALIGMTVPAATLAADPGGAANDIDRGAKILHKHLAVLG
jgi:hypothetical protein